MHPILNIAARAARKAGNLITKYYEMFDKKNDNSFVTNINKSIEAVVIETIHKSYPGHLVLTKKIGKYQNIDQDYQWIVKSLDGTDNFIKRFPHFAVSIAVRIKNRIEVSVVYDPIRNELFTATRGQGAQLNNYRIRSSNVRDLTYAILATGFPYKKRQHFTNVYMNIIKRLFSKCANFRSTGSPALDLSYIAAGRIDGYFRIGMQPWDFVAGELIARESGALICDFIGGHSYMTNGNVIAGNPRVVKIILENIQEELSEELKC